MNKKIQIVIIVVLLLVLWFTLVSSFIDMFRISSAIIDFENFYTPLELSTNLLFFNLINSIRLEGIQIAIAGGFLLVYYKKRK